MDITTVSAAYGPLQSLQAGGAPVAPPQGVVDNGKPGGVYFTPDGFAHRDYDASWEATTGTAGVQWDPAPGTMMYARYSRGYLMGGFAAGVTSSLGQFPFTDAEHVNDFELGLKKDFGSRFQLDVAVFYEDLTGYQVPLSVVSNTGALAVNQSRLLNVPKAEIKGIEIEGSWAPIDHLTFQFIYDYNVGNYTSLTGNIDPADPDGGGAGGQAARFGRPADNLHRVAARR